MVTPTPAMPPFPLIPMTRFPHAIRVCEDRKPKNRDMFKPELTDFQPSRLPVNPRRHKVPSSQRKRVTTACNNCNVRRVKCSGERPCLQCNNTARQCVYPEPLANVTISRTELENLRRRCAVLEHCLENSASDGLIRRRVLAPQPRPTQGKAKPPDDFFTTAPKTVFYPEVVHKLEHDITESGEKAWLHDTDGTTRHLEETSGDTFLDDAKDFLKRMIALVMNKEPWMKSPDDIGSVSSFPTSLAQYQMHNLTSLCEPEVDPFWLPPQDEMTSMFAELRCIAQDGNGSFPSGGIFYWWEGSDSELDEPLTATTCVPPDSWVKHRHLAFYNAVFALICQARKPIEGRNVTHVITGEAYFKRAKILLGNPLDARRYTVGDISTMALMAFYLLENNRRDTACMYVGVAIHIAVMNGAFKSWTDERGKRVFWTLYILDRWLSCLMGRAPILLDDTISLGMPTDMPPLPPSAGLVANIELARITSYVGGKTYSAALWAQQPRHHDDVGGQTSQYHTDETMIMLESWRSALPESLQLGREHISNDSPVCRLHMNHNQLIILTARPIFFAAVKKTVAECAIGRPPSPWRQQPEHHILWDIEKHPQSQLVKAGLSAARWNMRIGRWLAHLVGARRRMLHTELHYVFTAAILIILESLVCSFTPAPDEDVEWAIDILEDDSKSGNSYSKQCARVLRDFGILARRLSASLTRGQESIDPGASLATPAETLDTSSSCSTSATFQMQAWMQGAVEQGMAPNGGTLGIATAGLSPISHANGQTAMAGGTADENADLYHELVTWMDTDDLQLYGNFAV